MTNTPKPTEKYTDYIRRQMADVERQQQLAAKYQKKVRYVQPSTDAENSAMNLFLIIFILVGIAFLWRVLG